MGHTKLNSILHMTHICLGCNDFSTCNILNTKQESGKIIKTVLKFIKNTGLIYHNHIYLKSLHSPEQDWRRYATRQINLQQKKKKKGDFVMRTWQPCAACISR